MKLTNRTILILILAVAAILRFYRYTEIPYTHDEFSALSRTEFSTFSDLIEQGVRPDGHPAGVQVFLYFWTHVMGNKEWVVKLPFAIMGLLSVLLIYMISRIWYNHTVALIGAAFVATIQYTIMYSQIARPYASGLFFSLAMVYFWSRLMNSSSGSFRKNGLLYVLTSALCAYNHHFSLLFAAIVWISGLFIVHRKFLSRYILCGTLIVVLYIPHIGIFMNQFSTGGVGGWLAKPKPSFFLEYPYYIFNFSPLSILLVLGLIIYGYIFIKKNTINIRIYLLSVFWFLLPLLIGYLYSVYVNPVLQYSVLLFSFFPILFILFGHIPEQNPLRNLMLVTVIMSINIFSLLNERRHYDIFYKSVYEHIILDFEEAKSAIPNLGAIIDSHKKITNFYTARHQADSIFTWFDSFDNEASFIRHLKKLSEHNEYLYFGALSSNKPNTIPLILEYFPNILDQKNYFMGSTWLFAKEGRQKPHNITLLDFSSPAPEGWRSIKNENIGEYNGNPEQHYYLMDSLTEWSPTFSAPLNPLITHHNNFIDLAVDVHSKTGISEILLIATLESKGEVVHFSGADFSTFIDPNTSDADWYSVHHSLKLADFKLHQKDLVLNVYVWNKGRHTFLIDNFRINAREGNPIIYSLYEKIP